MSKTQDALAFLAEHQDDSVYAVAKRFGLAPTTLYTALAREKVKAQKEPCPCCGSLVPGEKINRDVLKNS
ncbi:hypothetical protein [Dechloromonas sp. H13]|uniref:hypothetical protein n=1 Tax=Dechloromonas sp. H13 TaxID=2570193 RepID=UPI001292B9E8|nr:hypothetical protein [Dechloromonas sp. H13]